MQGALEDILYLQDQIPPQQFLITLNYDKNPFESKINSNIHIYFPDSTWASGRNLLLERAQALEIAFDYFIFLDADLRIIKGDFQYFEHLLDHHQPKLGLPLGDEIKGSYRYFPSAIVQTQFSFDQILQAYRSDVVHESICVPYVTDFDSDSWWYSCQINSYLSLLRCSGEILQFNHFEIENSRHDGPDLNLEGVSNYRAGVDAKGLRRCRVQIESNFGKQKKTFATLFHPRLLPKVIFYPTLSQLLNDEFNQRRSITLKRVLRALTKSFQLFMYQNVFRSYNIENLITVEEPKKNTL